MAFILNYLILLFGVNITLGDLNRLSKDILDESIEVNIAMGLELSESDIGTNDLFLISLRPRGLAVFLS